MSLIYAVNGKSTESNTGNYEDSESYAIKHQVSTDNKSIQATVIPNPNTGRFIFEVNQSNPKGNLYVYSIDGKMLYQKLVNSQRTELDLSLRKGLYLAVYKEGNDFITVKLIVE